MAARATLLLLLTGFVTQARSQTPEPFSTLAVSLSLATVANNDARLDSWDPGPGPELRVLTPFYAGSAEIGLHQQTFDARTAGVPGFRGRFIFAGWGWDVRATRSLRLRVATRIGVYDFQFDAPSLPSYSRSENEVATSVGVEAAWALGSGWEVMAAGRGRIVLTEPRMRQLVLAAGVGRTFTTPSWLRDFLD